MRNLFLFRSALSIGMLILAVASASCSRSDQPAAPSGMPARAAGPNAPAATAPVGAPTAAPVAAPVVTRMTSEQEVSGAYRQGVARVPDGWIFSTNLALYRTDDELHETVKNEQAIPPEWAAKGFNHIGDIDVVEGVVYAPIEQPDYEKGIQAMFRYDAATLRFIDGVEVKQHENSYVTVDPATLTAYTLDRFGGDAQLRYDVKAGWKLLAPMPMSRFVDKVQGADVADGAIWLAADDDHDGLYRVILATGQTDDIGSIGHVDGEGEGIDATALPSGLLHVISIDARFLPVRFIHFAVAPEGG